MRTLFLFLLALIAIPLWSLSSPPPVIFYTDLTSGPKVGGENNNGTILTICGKNFGTTRGTSTVTIGGGAPAAYILWAANGTGPCGGGPGNSRGLDSISVAIGSAAATGAVVVTVGGVGSNTDKTFTVNTWSATNDRIFCEDSATGSDSNNGQCPGDTQTLPGTPGPWKTIRHVKGLLNTGDIVYFASASVNYVSETDVDLCYAATFAFSTGCFGPGTKIAHNGTAVHPISLVGYPGAIAQIGCATTACPSIVFGAITLAAQYWNIINLVEIPGQCTVASGHCTNVVVSGGALGGIRIGGAGGTVKDGPGGDRFINNNSQCPNGNQGSSGCLSFTINSTVNTPGTISNYVLGNHFWNFTDYPTDTIVGWRHTFAMYLGYDANEVEVAWNDIDGSAGYSSEGVHIHSSAQGTTGGFPLYGIHFHDNYVHDTPAGNDLSTFNPIVGSGVEFYNNLHIHQGDCLAYPGSGTGGNTGGWIQGYRRNGAHSVGQPAWDENWSAMHGTIHFYNNTYKDIGNCAGSPDGWVSFVSPSGTSASVKPPPDITICASSCSITQSGTLPVASPTYAADNVGFQVTNGSTFVTSLYDDGLGHLLEKGTNVGTFDYGTGAYSFTLTEGSLNPAAIIKYRTIYGYYVSFQNNIIWQRSATPGPYVGFPTAPFYWPKVSGDHNLFFTTGGQTVPSMFTSNIGSNADPLFVSNGTLGAVPSNGDYHLQGTSPAIGAGIVTAAARDYDGNLRTAPYTAGALVPVTTPCIITSASPLPSGTTNVVYPSVTLTSSGCGTVTGSGWVVTSGTLPTGLTLHSATGVIDGTPTVAAVYNFVVKFNETGATNPTQAFQITINAPAPVCNITSTAPFTSGNQNVAYSFTVVYASCTSPLTWTISVGSLPSGLTIDSSTGVISGTPTGSGLSSFTVRVVDALSNPSTVATGITIVAAPICVITTASPLPGGTQTFVYSPVTLQGSGCGSPTGSGWVVTVGSIPTGLTLHSTTGVIDGTPSGTGTSNFTVQFNESSAQNPTKAFSITIAAAPPTCGITSVAPFPAGTQNSVYTPFTIGTSNCTAPVVWSVSVGSLPTGLSLAASTGIISGTPTTSGTFNFTVRVVDNLTHAAILPTSIAVAPVVTPNCAITSTSPFSSGNQNLAYTFTVQTSNCAAPVTWSVVSGALPVGLSLAASTGVISGTPTGSGVSNFTVQVLDNTGHSASLPASITITAAPACVITTTSPLPTGSQSVAYSAVTLTASNCGAVTGSGWVLLSGALPTGLTLHSSTGVIDGTPSVIGTFNFVVTFNETGGTNPSAPFQTTINAGCSITTRNPLPSGFVRHPYAPPLQETSGGCGTGTPAWTVSVGALPTGLSLSSAGVISGKPTAMGLFIFSVHMTGMTSTPTDAQQQIIINGGGSALNSSGNLTVN